MKAYEVIEQNDWLQGGPLAIDASGKEVSTFSDDAVAFCMLGAIQRAHGSKSNELIPILNLLCRNRVETLFQHAIGKKYYGSESALFNFNDRKTTTKCDVIKALKKANI